MKTMAQSNSASVRVLHVEVGGNYGGSLRALELYLRYTDRSCFAHDVLFYYPTPGMEKLAGLTGKIATLYDALPVGWGASTEDRPPNPWTRWKAGPAGRNVADLRDWTRLFLPSETVRRIAQRFMRETYDLIHINNTFTYQEASVLAARRSRIPLIAHVRNPVPKGRFARKLLRCIDTTVTVSSTFEKELCSWRLRRSIHTCYDGVERPVVNDPVAATLRTSLLPSGRVLVGSVGRLEVQKGFHDLIRAARIVIDSEPEIRFAIAGEGSLRSSLEALIAELGLKSHFQLCGFRSDIANFLGALDLLVSSSHWEGLPLAVVEAMMLRKPVVATDVGGTSEVVVDQHTGALVPPGAPKILANAILSAVKQKSAASSWAGEAQSLASELFDPARSARELDSIIQSTISGKQAPTQKIYAD